MKISLVLIYQGNSGDLRNSWINNVSDDIVYFIVTLTR